MVKQTRVSSGYLGAFSTWKVILRRRLSSGPRQKNIHSHLKNEQSASSFPVNPETGSRTRIEGTIEVVKPGYILVQPEKGPVILSKTTILNGANLKEKQKVSLELTFSAKGPLAENLKVA